MNATNSPASTLCLQNVSAPTLRTRIVWEIRQAILRGLIREGERLVERKLAAQLGTSLTAVREAMVELETEGFLTKKPNSATHVTKLSWPEIEKIFAVRRVLEAHAVEEATRQVTPDQLEAAEQICWEMAQAARANDSQAFNQQDVAFHLLLWRATGNEYLEAALKRAVLPFFAFAAIRIIASRGPLDLFQEVASHVPILEGLKSRDPAAARAAFLKGLEDWYRTSRVEMTDARLGLQGAALPSASKRSGPGGG